jgi:hypothetical protein
MSDRGVLFALTKEEFATLRGAKGDPKRRAVIEDIEERWDKEWLYQTDKAWYAIHHCLASSDFSDSDILKTCLLEGDQLHRGTSWVINHTPTDLMSRLAAVLRDTNEGWLAERFYTSGTFPSWSTSDRDFAYTLGWFVGLPSFVAKAATNSRHLVFTVDCT